MVDDAVPPERPTPDRARPEHREGDAGPQRPGARGHRADVDARSHHTEGTGVPVEGQVALDADAPFLLVGDAGPPRPGPDVGHRSDADERAPAATPERALPETLARRAVQAPFLDAGEAGPQRPPGRRAETDEPSG